VIVISMADEGRAREATRSDHGIRIDEGRTPASEESRLWKIKDTRKNDAKKSRSRPKRALESDCLQLGVLFERGSAPILFGRGQCHCRRISTLSL
jgi:hypothetical protein